MGALRGFRAVPVAVWAATVLFALLLAGWSVLAPLGRAPDESAHADLILHLASGAGYPEYDERDTSAAVLAVGLAHMPGLALGDETQWLTPEGAEPRRERPTFDEWGGAATAEAWPNQMPQHPPLYYWASAAALRVERALWPGDDPAPLDREWHVLRLFNVALLVPLPLLAWGAARRLGVDQRGATAAAVVPLAIPQLTHIGGSINNDNLLVLLGAVLAVQVAGVLRGDARLSTGAWIGVTTGLALATKAFALVLLPWIALAYGWRAWRSRPQWQPAARALLAAAVPAAVIGGAWPLRNLLEHGEPFPNIADRVLRRRVPGVEVDPVGYLREYGASMVHRFWGHLGWFEAPMRPVVVAIATVLTVVAVVAAFAGRRRDAPPSPSRAALAVFTSLFGLLFVFLLVNDLDRYRLSGQHGFMQGRYLFVAIVPFVTAVAVGTTRLLGRWAPLALLAAAGVMQAEAARVALRTWWAEPDATLRRSVVAVVRWSPWPEPLTVAIGLGVVVAGIVTAVTLARTALRAGGAGSPSGTDAVPTIVAP